MADGYKTPFLPSISPNPRPPQKELVNLRQTVDIMLKQIHANQEAIHGRDNEIIALRMELHEVKKATNDKIFRMSNNIKSLKQQLNDLRQRESVINDLENELKNCTSKQDELITFQESQDSKLNEMESSIIESCQGAIADIRTKQMRETEETSQSQIQSLSKIISVQGILRSNVQSVQTLLDKKTGEDNRRFQKQENYIQLLQPKIDQALNLESSMNKMIAWRKSKTESDKKNFEKLRDHLIHLQTVVSSKQPVDKMEMKVDDDLALTKENKTTDNDKTIQDSYDKEIHNLKSRMKSTEASIYGISRWQRDKLDSDKKSQEINDTKFTELRQRVDDFENRPVTEKEDGTTDSEKKDVVVVAADKVDTWNYDRPDHTRMIARLKRKSDNHEEQLEILEERLALTTTNVQVNLNTSQALQSGQRTKLDKCVKVWFDSNDLFDKDACCLVPRRNCRMALAWRLCQYGEGVLEAWMGVDGVEEGDYLGKTTKENEVMSGMLMWGVRKGQKIWMEVERGEGEAGLWNCLFMAWVVG